MNRRRLVSAALAGLLCAAAAGAFAQRPEETLPRVQALSDFHEVVYRIWHEAWPKKDAALLRTLLPDVEKGVASVAAAPLPGILRDKKGAWDEGVRKLQGAGADYAAAAAKDDAALLAAAEELHGRFEGLMRIIRPPLEEIDAFHAVLYMLVHHYLPKSDSANVRKSAAELTEKMATLNRVELPERLLGRDRDFQAARGLLSKTVAALDAAVRTRNETEIKEAVEAVHSAYQALEKVFN